MESRFSVSKKYSVFSALIILFILLVCVSFGAENKSSSKVTNLTCEYMTNPLGMDTAQPRLSWMSYCDGKNQGQSAYRIRCSSSISKLNSGEGDLWDSGKVESDRSVLVKYQGDELKPFAEVFWNVQVWDTNGKSIGTSKPAKWTMGPLANWGGKWIKYSSKETLAKRKVDLGNAKWIWADGVDVGDGTEKTVFLRKKITLDNKEIKQATCKVTAGERFTLYINEQWATKSDRTRESWKTVHDVDITEYLREGENIIAAEVNAGKEKDIHPGLIALFEIEYKDGTAQQTASSQDWRVSTERKDGLLGISFDDSAWSNAKALDDSDGEKLKESLVYATDWDQLRSSPLLRKEFNITKPIKSACVYISGLGYYEMNLNGKKVGDHRLDPAFTKYDKRVLYVTYDVTNNLKSGKNAVGVMLGNGWYNVHTLEEWDFNQAPWRDEPKMIFLMNINYLDGTSETIVSDDTWKGSTGPVVLDGIRNSEYYDARLEKSGWDKADFNDSDWENAQLAKEPGGKLCAQIMPAVKVIETIKPVKITEPEENVYVFEMGVNFAGWIKLKTSGPAGTKIKIRYNEILNSAGYIKRSETAPFIFHGPFQTDIYILKGEGIEEWQPRFTYYGFKYVEVTGLTEKPTLDTIEGQFASTGFQQRGEFECSNEMFNKIQQMALRSYRSNFYGYPTDCPQREKNGWTGDAHLATEMGLYNFASAPAYTKWMNDFKDAQLENGKLPSIIPTSGWGYWNINSAWDSAYLLIPWYMYTYCGDISILENHYDGMKLYVDLLTKTAKDNIAEPGLGDWVPAKTETPSELVTTSYYYIDNIILAKIAKIMGNTEDEKKYNEQAQIIKQSFNKHFYKGDGIYANGSQTSLLTALYYGLVEDSQRQLVFDKLLQNIKANDDHLDCGIMGTKYIFNVLADNGRIDVAYKIANQKTFPSYGEWIERGATTLHEDWKSASSFNHIMFGDISAWFYKNIAGIKADINNPGFKHIIIEPQPVGDLKWAKAKYKCPYGEIKSEWKIENDNFELKVTIPFNTTATVLVPADADWAKDNSQNILQNQDTVSTEVKNNKVIFNIGSGSYTFKSKVTSNTAEVK